MSIWDHLSASGEPFYQVGLRGDGGWYAPHDLDDFPLGYFATRDEAVFVQSYARGLLAVLAVDPDARPSVPARMGTMHRDRFEALR